MTTHKKDFTMRLRNGKTFFMSIFGMALLMAVVTATVVIVGQFTPTREASAHLTVPNPDAWVVDGQVRDIEFDSDKYYLAGTITSSSEYTGHGVALSKADFSLSDSVRTRFENTVYAAEPDGLGGWFVGGNFTQVDNLSYRGLAHVEADGSLTTTWLPDIAGQVRTLYLDGTTLYVGGSFTSVLGGATTRRNAVAFDVSDLSTATVLPWNPNPSGGTEFVTSINKFGSTVYLSGTFGWVNNSSNTALARLAAVDATTGVADTTWSPAPSNNVDDIEIKADGSVMYIGGSFTTVNAIGRDDLAAITLADGINDATVFDWNPDVQGEINSIELNADESILIVGGTFSNLRQGQANQLTVNDLAAMSADETDATAAPVTTWTPDSNGVVQSIDLYGNELYVTGTFTTLDGVSRNRFANIDVSSFASVSMGSMSIVVPGSGNGQLVRASDTELFVGGDFAQLAGVSRQYVVEYDIATNEPTSLDLQLSGGNAVNALAVDGNIMYLGGAFTSVLGGARDSLAAVDMSTMTLLPWSADTAGPGGGHVWDMELDGDTLYVVGQFQTLGGVARDRIAAYDVSDPNNITLLPFNPGADNIVYELETDDTDIYVGGIFTAAGNNGGSPGTGVRSRLAAIDKSTGAADLTWIDPDNGNIESLDLNLATNRLYVVGTFTLVEGASHRAFDVDTTTGQMGSWTPTLNGIPRTVFADVNAVYVAGDFTVCDGASQRLCVYEFDGSLASWNPDFDAAIGGVRAPMARRDQYLHLGGAFTSVAGEQREGYVQFALTQVQFTEASSIAPETDPSTTVTAEATQSDTTSATVDIVGGTATENIDYTLDTTTINFTPGDTTADITLGLDNDFIAENPETAVIEITEVSSSGIPGSVTLHTLTIIDDDVAGGTLSSPAVSATEGSTQGTYTVQLTSEPLADVTVTLNVADPSQATVSPGELTFIPANWNSPQTVTATAVDDSAIDGTVEVSVGHTTASGDTMYQGLDIGTVTVSALDNDSASEPTDPQEPGEPPVGPGIPEVPAGVTVIHGDDPAEQAIAVSNQRFSAGLAQGVALTRDDVAVDALTVGPFVNLDDLSLLLTPSNALSDAALAEIDRVLGDTAKPIYLVGGVDALSPEVEAGLRANGYENIQRFAGADRRQTAALIANAIVTNSTGPVTSVFVADDDEFVDALTVGADAGRVIGGVVKPILLSRRGSATLDSAAADFMAGADALSSVVIVGGPAALPSGLDVAIASQFPTLSIERIGGETRFDTNAQISNRYFTAPTTVYIARGDRAALPGAGQLGAASASASFYGALFAGTLGADNNGPVLLVSRDVVPEPIVGYLQEHASTITQATVITDITDIGAELLSQIADLI